ncbi:RNA-binding protein, putative [Plasmodium vinckei brucechwatti]|uniref:RNA-binding protein, putative n=2 Tax=Plasmodium TaxID=5820 RepID=A0A6V7RSB2_PLAVN|nr:RNA-binding protein, putative [Plasmodium vinckei brucechwatti]
MIKQKRSYSHMENDEGKDASNISDDEVSFKRQRNNSHSSNMTYGSMNDEFENGDGSNKLNGGNMEMLIPYCLLLPNRAIGYVIGKSGNNVREIEKACGAIIKCQKEFDIPVYPPPSEKILTISGKKENKKKALELVLNKSKTVMDFQEEDGKESIVIIVPTRSIPIIIGQKGSKISSLSERSACEINVHKEDVPGIKDKAIFIKSNKIIKIIDCISIIYDLLEEVAENGILEISEFPGVSKNFTSPSNMGLCGPPPTNAPSSFHENSTANSVSGVSNHYNDTHSMNSGTNQYRGSRNNNMNYNNNNMGNNGQKFSMKNKDNNYYDNYSTHNMDDYDNFSVPREKNLLLHKFGKESSSCVVRFVLDVETTAWIIGKAGCHIKEIRTITGAGAVIVDAPDNIENVKTCDRILTLSGSAENKYNALKLIVKQMEEREKNINNSMRMLVPGKAASFLIGRKGSIIKYITEQSGSQIQVAKNKESENEKLVLISGSPESKILASVLILQKLEEYDNPAIAREGLLIPLNDLYYSNNKNSNMKKNNNSSILGSGGGPSRMMQNNVRGSMNNNSGGNNNRYYNSAINNNSGNNMNSHMDNMNNDDNNSSNYRYDNNKNNMNNIKNKTDAKEQIENIFLNEIYKSIPITSLPKILSVKQPYTIELNMPDVYLETFDSQNKDGKSLIEEITDKTGCNISVCTDSNDSSSYTFNVSLTGSPLANSLAILMIQSKIFQFDWF